MKREDKQQIIEQIAANLKEYENFYLTDIATLNAAKTSNLRRECYKQEIKLVVVKNLIAESIRITGRELRRVVPCIKREYGHHVL